jgi:hypothetical protein
MGAVPGPGLSGASGLTTSFERIGKRGPLKDAPPAARLRRLGEGGDAVGGFLRETQFSASVRSDVLLDPLHGPRSEAELFVA